jgi:hypothetical protein
MGGLAAKFLAGLGISWDLSIGKRYESSAPAGTAGPGPAAAKDKTASGGPSGSPAPGPNAIALGCTSVIIGG